MPASRGSEPTAIEFVHSDRTRVFGRNSRVRPGRVDAVWVPRIDLLRGATQRFVDWTARCPSPTPSSQRWAWAAHSGGAKFCTAGAAIQPPEGSESGFGSGFLGPSRWFFLSLRSDL